jgi:hypothetical protein
MCAFEHPFTWLISGPSGCGKTSFCVRLISNIGTLCTEPNFRQILWCYSENAAVPREQLAQVGKPVAYHRGVPDFENRTEGGCDGARILLVLDDLLNEVYWRDVCNLFTGTLASSSSRRTFHQGRFSRDTSLNAK